MASIVLMSPPPHPFKEPRNNFAIDCTNNVHIVATTLMSPEALQLVLSAKADEILNEAPAFQGVLVIASSSTPDETRMHGFCRGNRHAAIAAAEEWLAAAKAYDHAYHAEQGRYDAVCHRHNQRP